MITHVHVYVQMNEMVCSADCKMCACFGTMTCTGKTTGKTGTMDCCMMMKFNDDMKMTCVMMMCDTVKFQDICGTCCC